MRFDPLDTAYQIVKELDVGDDRAIFGLGGSALWYANEQKKMFLSELGDTYYRMPWNDALEIMRESGFEIVQDREVPSEWSTDVFYKRVVAATPDGKMILTANGGKTNGQWALDAGTELRVVVDTHGSREVRDNLVRIRHSQFLVGEVNDYTDWRFALIFTVTEGLKIILDDIRDSGVELIDWPEDERLVRLGFDRAALMGEA